MVKVTDKYKISIQYPERQGFIILSHGILRSMINYFGVLGSIESQSKDEFIVSADQEIIYAADCTNPSEIDITAIFNALSKIKPPVKDISTLDLSTESLTEFPVEEEYDTCYCSGE